MTVEEAKSIQANAFIQAGIFQHYSIAEEQEVFKINLSVLLVSTAKSPSEGSVNPSSPLPNVVLFCLRVLSNHTQGGAL